MKRDLHLRPEEEQVFLQLLYMAPDESADFQSLNEASRRAGDRFHREKIKALGIKLKALGYGELSVELAQINVEETNFKLSKLGYDAVGKLANSRQHVPIASRFNWQTVGTIISALAAVASAYFAYRART